MVGSLPNPPDGKITYMTSLVSLSEIQDAANELTGVIRRTPMEPARDPRLPRDTVFLKCENLQRAGSFKIRGAYLRISRLPHEDRKKGVVAASAGNHAQGVALAAKMLGITSTVFMPKAAPLPKLAATKDYGADVILGGDTVDDALESANKFAAETGATLIHPFDHLDVVRGQGTVALEILDQCPKAATVVVSIGGGGLAAGVAAAAKAIRPDVRVIGVQAADAAAYPPSLKAGKPIKLQKMQTIADGIAVGLPGDITFPHIRDLIDEVVTVTEEDITRALLSLQERNKLIAEPAGGTAYAALLTGQVPVDGPTVAILSGGNIDPLLQVRLIGHGLALSGRYLRCNLRCADKPGTLASVLNLLAERGGNIVDVTHQRTDPRLHIGEVSIDLSVETRGDDHAAHLVAAMRDAGFSVTVNGPTGRGLPLACSKATLCVPVGSPMTIGFTSCDLGRGILSTPSN